MSNNEIVSKASVHQLTEFAIAKSVVKDFPIIMMVYSKVLPMLEHYRHYAAVGLVVSAIEEAQILMDIQLREYTKVKKNKARKLNE